MKTVLYRLMGEQSFVTMRWTVVKAVLSWFRWGAVFRYKAVDCTEVSFIQVGGRGAVFRYTAVECIEECIIQVGGRGAGFRYTAVDCNEECFIQVGGEQS